MQENENQFRYLDNEDSFSFDNCFPFARTETCCKFNEPQLTQRPCIISTYVLMVILFSNYICQIVKELPQVFFQQLKVPFFKLNITDT